MLSSAEARVVARPIDVRATAHTRSAAARRVAFVVAATAALVLVVLASLAVGAKSIEVGDVIDAFAAYDRSNSDHLVVRELRVPRTVIGVLVGVALGLAGAVMQAVSRNPIADPGILGVNAGAAFAVVLVIWRSGTADIDTIVWFALIGAATASVAVYALGSLGRGGATPVRLALAGAALTALLLSLTRAVTLLDQNTLDQFRFWAVGSLTGRDPEVAWTVGPLIAAGAVLAIALTRPLNALGLGDDAASGLGIKVGTTRALAGLSVVLLCGAAVAAVGPIGFIGLVVPHAVRAVVGPDQRWLLPGCALAGPTVLLACDTLGRVVARPGEVQVGIMTAAVGGPAFVLLVRRARMVAL